MVWIHFDISRFELPLSGVSAPRARARVAAAAAAGIATEFFLEKNVLCSEEPKNSNQKYNLLFFKLLLKFGRLRKLFNDYVSHVSVFPNSWTISFTIRSACALPPSAALEPGLLLKISNRSCFGLKHVDIACHKCMDVFSHASTF